MTKSETVDAQTRLVASLLQMGLLKAYGLVAASAWQKRLTNADIAAIERKAIGDLELFLNNPAPPEIDAPAAVAETQAILRELFASVAVQRVPQ